MISKRKPTRKFITVHMCVHIIVQNCCTQHSTEQFCLFFILTADSYQRSDAVYWSGGDTDSLTFADRTFHVYTEI